MTQNRNKGKQHSNKIINRHFNKTQNRRKCSIDDYIFYLGTSKQASDFKVSSEFILNYIKRTFKRGNDTAESLQTVSKIDMQECRPQLETSKSKSTTIKEVENKQFELEFKAKLQESIKCTTVYEENLYKAYTFLWEKCSKRMQNKIASCKDYEKRIYNNPINLLIRIKEHSLNYQETRNKISIIADSI